MQKKTLSIILSIVMMLSMVSTSVLAALPTSKLVVDADSAVTTEGRWLDDFSQYTEENTTTFNNYPRANLSQTSEVFADKAWATMFQIVDADTSENAANMALKILPIAQNVTFSPKSFTMTDGQMLRYSYDICFKDMITETGDLTFPNAAIALGSNTGVATRFDVKATDSNGSVVYKLQYQWADKCTIDQNKWYRIIYYLSSDKKTMSAYFADATTGEIYFSVENHTHTSAINLITYNHTNAERAKLEGYCLIDNVELTAYTPANYAPDVIKKSITDTGVATDVGTIDITFDQPIGTMPSSVSLTADGKDALTATVAKVANKLNTYTLTLPVMEGGTTYTADLSGFKNAGEAAANSLSFTTAAAAPVVLSSTPANGATDVSVETSSATVTFDQAMITYPATLTLAGGITTTVTPDNDKKVFTISWSGELAGDTTYSLSLADFKNAEGKSSSTEAISFTTEFAGIVTESDSFEEPSLLRTWMDYKSTASVSTPFETLSATYGEDVTPLSFVEGYNGGNALQLATGSTGGKLYLNSFRTAKAYSLAEGEKFVATWRFNVKEMAAVDEAAKKTGSSISIGCSTANYLSWGNTIAMIITKDGKPFIYHSYDNPSLGRTIEEDHWYNVYYVVENGDQTIYVVDAQGENKGTLIYKRAKGGEQTNKPTLSEDAPAYIHVYSGARTETKTDGEITNIVNDSQKFLLDDFTLWRINPSKSAQKLTLTASDEDAVLDKDDENNNSITMTFNQPVMADSTMLELYKGTGKNELAYSTVNARWTDFCTQEVSFSNLKYLTDYTLDYSGVNAVSGADLGEDTAAATLSFSTMADPNQMSITSDITCTGLNEGDKVSFDMYSRKAGTVKVIAAFYERSFPEKLSGAEMADVTVNQGVNDVVLTLTKAQTADYIKIFVWNGLDELVPMSRVYEFHAPADTLDVLMIGNSLSEDAGRYFNSMTEAGDLTLNLTVKGVGGATLAHHAANLEAELAGRTAAEAQEQMDAEEVERALYFTYENGEIQTGTDSNKLLIDALKNKQYDIISLQQFSPYTDSDFEESLPYLAAEIRKLQPNAEIVLYQTWSPKDSAKATRNYYFTNTIEPAVNKWAAYTGANVENITVNGEPMKIVSAGKAFYLADNKYSWCETAYTQGEGNTDAGAQTDAEAKMKGSLGLWRDYNHASYYGCYLADAVWYGTLTGKKAPVGTEASPVVAAPDGIGAAEHIERLNSLSDIAYQVVLEQTK